MFSPGLEKRWRGMLLGPKYDKHTVETHNEPKRAAPPDNTVRLRAIMREWPRNPKGPIIGKNTLPRGKVIPNGHPLWGATVFDFFFVQRAPGIAWKTAANSSRLLAWVKEIGELDHAKEEIAWAEEEENPQELFPCDVARLLRDADRQDCPIEKLRNDNHKLPNGRMSATRYHKFQNRLPFHLLPERLIVHDPDNTLYVGEKSKINSGERDTPRIYKLELTKETRDAIASTRATPAKPPVNTGTDGAHTSDSKNTTSRKVKEDSVAELMTVVLPPPPPSPLSTPEAHLYINAEDKLGEGNHSQVYHAAWEIPQSLVKDPYLCEKCINESLFKKLSEEAPEAKVTASESLDFRIKELMSHIANQHGRKGTLSTVEVTSLEEQLELVWPGIGMSETLSKSSQTTVQLEYEGTVHKVHIDVGWSTPGNVCEHEEVLGKEPTTFKVNVTAKLSYKGDNHLPREAKNYQEFPAHFFQHWSGYNIVWPLQDPTPALAVVPQFYGYYVPEDGQVQGKEYLSPILLLENCGTPVNVNDLTVDDRNECASLLLRMHAEGWLHNSFFSRNLLMQYGDITQWPAFREEKDRRFRLIDFGRSVYYTQKSRECWQYEEERFREERDCKNTLDINTF